jgi:hypothetical protein
VKREVDRDLLDRVADEVERIGTSPESPWSFEIVREEKAREVARIAMRRWDSAGRQGVNGRTKRIQDLVRGLADSDVVNPNRDFEAPHHRKHFAELAARLADVLDPL